MSFAGLALSMQALVFALYFGFAFICFCFHPHLETIPPDMSFTEYVEELDQRITESKTYFSDLQKFHWNLVQLA